MTAAQSRLSEAGAWCHDFHRDAGPRGLVPYGAEARTPGIIAGPPTSWEAPWLTLVRRAAT